MRILVIEDEVFLADMVAKGLRRQAMAVDVAYDGDTAMELVDVNAYDVLVLDRDVPGVHGDDICRALAQRGDTLRILMLTAMGSVHDRVGGLNLGADDYLAKPFAFDELVARVRALGRRAVPPVPPVLAAAGITLDTGLLQVHRDGQARRATGHRHGPRQRLPAVRAGVRLGRRFRASGGGRCGPG